MGISIQCLTINFYFTNTTSNCAVFTNVHYNCTSSGTELLQKIVFSETGGPAWLLLVQCHSSEITTNAEITQGLGNKSFESASRLLSTKYTGVEI